MREYVKQFIESSEQFRRERNHKPLGKSREYSLSPSPFLGPVGFWDDPKAWFEEAVDSEPDEYYTGLYLDTGSILIWDQKLSDHQLRQLPDSQLKRVRGTYFVPKDMFSSRREFCDWICDQMKEFHD